MKTLFVVSAVVLLVFYIVTLVSLYIYSNYTVTVDVYNYKSGYSLDINSNRPICVHNHAGT